MTVSAPATCARCATPIEPRWRFCPECGFPASGEAVLSTQIREVRQRAERRGPRGNGNWTRVVLPTAAVAMSLFVVGLGLLLFNGPLLDRLFPPAAPRTGGHALPPVPAWEPEWVVVEPGEFPFGDGGDPDDPGDDLRARVAYEFRISKYEVTNELWADFLRQEEAQLKAPGVGLWSEAFPGPDVGWQTDAAGALRLPPDMRHLPVRNVSPLAVAEFCLWLTRRMDQPGWEIRIPTGVEWEYAARGKDGRTYPWGNDFWLPRPPGTGGGPDTRRKALCGNLFAVEAIDDDTSPFGVVAMGTNVSEWTIDCGVDASREVVVELQQPGQRPVAQLADHLLTRFVTASRRGASFGHYETEAPKAARTWERVSIEDPRQRFTFTGVRLVKVKVGP